MELGARFPPGSSWTTTAIGRRLPKTIHLEVYVGAIARTNIDIDEKLVRRAMLVYGLSTKRAAVDFALRQLVASPMSADEARAMRGSGWEADLDVLRRSDHIGEL